jgi:hypothetical protein
MNKQITASNFMGPPVAGADHVEVQADVEKTVRKTTKRKITTMALTSETCKWPFGDPTASDFHYCGRLPQNGGTYCEKHTSMSYQAARRRTPSIPTGR